MPEKLEVVTTSLRYALNRCPQLWWWRFPMGLTPKQQDADARWFGIGVHLALADWYGKGKRRGPHPAKTFREWAGDEVAYIKTVEEEFDLPKYEDASELGNLILEEYVDHYGRDPQWNIIAIEQQFKTLIKDGGKPVAKFMSTFDGVTRDEEDGQVYLLEHKTAREISTAYLELDPQAGAYWAVATAILRAKGLIGPKEYISGIMYNFLRKARPDIRPRDEGGAYLNKDGSVSKRQPKPIFHREPIERSPEELEMEMRALQDEVTFMKAMRDGTQPIRMNRTKDCPWCDYFDLCVLKLRGNQEAVDSYIASQYVQSDPFERYAQKSASDG